MTANAVACPECGERFAEAFEHCPQDGCKLGELDALCGSELGGRYFILTRIASGPFGTVYAASDERLHRRVAIKLLSPELPLRSTVIERFRLSFRAITALSHEHIVNVTDFQRDAVGLYFAMEYLRGQTLEQLLARTGKLDLEQAAHIAHQCCQALGVAHARGIVHGDLKPANVFLINRGGRSDFVKLLDFGIVRMLYPEGHPGDTQITRRYMSPEQIDGRPVDARSDAYALGTLLLEMLTGDPRLGSTSKPPSSPPRRRESGRPTPDVPEVIERVLKQALAPEPRARHEDVGALDAALLDAMRALRDQRLHDAFRAYDVPLPTPEAAHRLAAADRESFGLLESLRKTLGDEQRRLLAEQREAFLRSERALERRVAELEAQNRELLKRRD